MDTNVLLRAALKDDISQTNAAMQLLAESEAVAISSITLCEFAWVLRSGYGFQPGEIHKAIAGLVSSGNVTFDRGAVDAGLSILSEGGDFADGVIAHEGRWLGGETFVSFDRKAVALLTAQGHSARLLA